MGEKGSVFGVCDGFPPDDCDGGFEFEEDGEDLSIDIETIYRILDEKPDSAEGSQENSSPAGSSANELKNQPLQNGTQMVDWMPSRGSYSLRASHPGTGVSGSFDDHVKLDTGLSPSPARTCSASLKDWFSMSQDEQPVETCGGVAQSEMTSCSVSSGSVDRYNNTCFCDHGANVSFNPVNCDVDPLSKQDGKIIDSKVTSSSPTKYFEEVPGYGAGLGVTHNSSAMSGFCYNSNTLSDSADNGLSSAQNCYNTSGASLSEQTPNFVQNFEQIYRTSKISLDNIYNHESLSTGFKI